MASQAIEIDRSASTARIEDDIETLAGPDFTLSAEAIRRYEALVNDPSPALAGRKDELMFRLGLLYLEEGQAATATRTRPPRSGGTRKLRTGPSVTRPRRLRRGRQ